MAFLNAKHLVITTLGTAMLWAGSAYAQVVTIDQTQSAKVLNLPAKGSSKAAVAKKFGQPVKRVGAVGKPPISRWIYDDYIVVFEYNHVVHAFARLNEVENLTPSQISKRPKNAR